MKKIILEAKQVPQNMRFGNGKKFEMILTDKINVNTHDQFWSGGSKKTQFMARLSDGKTDFFNQTGSKAPWDIITENKSFLIPIGWIAVEHSYFCGKDMGYRFFVNPLDRWHFIKEDIEEIVLSNEEITVLISTKMFKNSYAGKSNIRFVEASITNGISLNDWNISKASLIEKKFLNRHTYLIL